MSAWRDNVGTLVRYSAASLMLRMQMFFDGAPHWLLRSYHHRDEELKFIFRMNMSQSSFLGIFYPDGESTTIFRNVGCYLIDETSICSVTVKMKAELSL
jgi:hypothetical protein